MTRYLYFLIPLVFLAYSCKSERNKPLFKQLSPNESGIDFSNNLKETKTVNYFEYNYLYQGGGVAIGDLNNDGLEDIYFTGSMVENKLYLNKGNLKFEDVTKKANVGGDDRWDTGVTMADVNNDGWLDIYVSVSGRWKTTKNLLYINDAVKDGIPTFTESGERYGVADIGNSNQAVFFDYDLDGDLDLYVANYPITDTKNGILNYYGMMKFVDESRSDHLYKNNNGKFEDVTVAAGVMRFGLSLGVSVGDFNQDDLPDIYVSNDFATPDYFFFNNGDGTFSNKIEDVMNHTAFYGMGLDVADINNNGLLDMFQVDMTPEDNFRSKTNMGSMNTESFTAMFTHGMYYQYMKNAFQLHMGFDEDRMPKYGEISQLADIALTDWSWAPLIADFDNDGWKDIFITNGSRREINNKDFFKEMNKDKQQKEHYLEWVNKMPEVKVENYAVKNQGKLKFKAIAKEWGINYKGWSNGAAYGDLDNDGDLDLVVSNIDDYSIVYENNSSKNKNANYLRIKMNGPKGNAFGLGCKVTLVQNENQQFQELTLTRGFQSSVEPVCHFGIGNKSKIKKVEVVWPDGKYQILNNIVANQELVVNYNDAIERKGSKKEKPNELFQNITNNHAIKHTHKENTFDDFRYQVLLPHKMSQFGPALAVGDVNGDGLDDFFVGGAKGFSSSLYFQDVDGKFSSQLENSFEEDKEFEDVDAVFFDANNDTLLDLYVVSGGNEFKSNDTHYQDRLYLNQGEGKFLKTENSLPVMLESGSVVRHADFDGDGDQDLFVGSRLSPRNYPISGNSFLLINESTKENIHFVDATNKLAKEIGNIGMVTDATWTDVNQDSYIDLVVTGEWMPITVFVNHGGDYFLNETKALGLNEQTGWWSSILANDFDNDGDIDLIGGNLGNNYKYKVSKEEPFSIYVNDYDENKKSDIVLSYMQNGKEYPLRGRSCSSQQIPVIAIKFKDYNSFAQATLADVYSKQALKESIQYQAVNFSTSYIENKNGVFSFNTLGKMAQISSVNAIYSNDINKDGHLDIVLAGNLYESEVETPRNDASYGLYMQGDGKGNFKTLMPYDSGLMIRGEVRKIKEMKLANGSTAILVARNNDSLQLIKI